MSLTEQTGQLARDTEAAGQQIPEATLLADAGHAGKIELLPLAKLQVDHAYQRDLNMELVQRIATGHDPAAAGLILVSRRESGDLFIINGQHRAAARVRMGEQTILAEVVEGLNAEQEAALRLKGNTARADNPYERFRAKVAAHEQNALAIDEMARKYGSKINAWPDMRVGINAIATVEWMFERDNGMTLSRVFDLIVDSFGNINGGLNANAQLLKAVAWMLDKHSSEMDRKRLVERLGAEGVEGLFRAARSHQANLGGSRWTNIYRAMVESYNGRLPEAQRIKWRTGGWTKGAFERVDTNNDTRGFPSDVRLEAMSRPGSEQSKDA